jgi:hypothetical protein
LGFGRQNLGGREITEEHGSRCWTASGPTVDRRDKAMEREQWTERLKIGTVTAAFYSGPVSAGAETLSSGR